LSIIFFIATLKPDILAAIGGYLFIVDITEKSIFNHL
jgi:hypothetical protein